MDKAVELKEVGAGWCLGWGLAAPSSVQKRRGPYTPLPPRPGHPLCQVGGMNGEPQKPTPFVCLILKMLQIQPDKDIIVEFIKNDDFKYLRLLGT